jgi:hypothetical protein
MKGLSVVLLTSLIWPAQAFAQTPRADCPPGVTTGSAPTIDDQGKETAQDKSLSDKLARSDGIICPPAGVDSEMHVKPPEGGQMRVIPPPGSPGGDPSVRPK